VRTELITPRRPRDPQEKSPDRQGNLATDSNDFPVVAADVQWAAASAGQFVKRSGTGRTSDLWFAPPDRPLQIEPLRDAPFPSGIEIEPAALLDIEPLPGTSCPRGDEIE
jgi:hypothetical protein